MAESNHKPRGRVFLAGKAIFNFGQSIINCTVRRVSEDGATLEFESALGIPNRFQVSIPSEGALLLCKAVWQSEKQIGVTFETPQAADAATSDERTSVDRGGEHVLRNQMLTLRAALDVVPLGIVLLDPKLNARFINRAFRRMWALSV